jgi:hypothetical protein
MLETKTRYQIWERLFHDDYYFNWNEMEYDNLETARNDLEFIREDDPDTVFSDFKIVKVTYDDVGEFLSTERSK